MPKYIVRLHLTLEAESAAAARASAIDAGEYLELEGLESACVDNESEIIHADAD